MKKILSLLLVVVMCLTTAPLQGLVDFDWSWLDFSVKASASTLSDKCGDNAYFTYDTETGELVISGTGDMWNYSEGTSPAQSVNVKSIVIENGITSIGDYSFEECSELTSVTIGDSVTTIGECTFGFCDNLTNVIIPDSVTTIGIGTFRYCSNLTNVTIGNGITSIEEGVFLACESLMNVTFGNSVKSIGDWAFWACSSLSNITIPDSVTTIGREAFTGCSKLTNVTIGNGVTSIGEYAFESCCGLTSVIIKNSTTNIGDGAFMNCFSLTEIDMGENIANIGYGAFSNCESLININIPDSVTTIDDCAFIGCTNLTNLTIPDSVTTIGNSAFGYCDNLKDVYYCGTEEQWKKISIGTHNEDLKNATIHYNSSGNPSIPTTSSTTYRGVTATIDSAYFENDSKNYNHDLGRFCSLFTVIGYKSKSTIKKHLENCGFTVDENYIVTNASRNEVNNFITHKQIYVDGKWQTLIFAGFIGSHQEQWYSNFDPEIGSTHLGFVNAKNYVYARLKTYIDNLNIYKDNTKILLTGHSRGAATCNLVAAQLISSEDYAAKENIYAYAFATPRISKAENFKDTKYNRVFNIINPEDFVTKLLPGAWGFSRVGSTRTYESVAVNIRTLPSKTNTKASTYKTYLNKMKEYYNLLKPDTPYAPYANGEATVHDIVYKFRNKIANLDEYYNKNLWTSNVTFMTPYAFFQNVLCPFVAKDYAKFATVSIPQIILIIKYSSSNNLYRKIIYFFLKSDAIDKIVNNEDVEIDELTNIYFAGSHFAETYCAYMYALSESEISVKRSGYQGSVNCPVDVEIYDNETSELVGRIVNNVVDEEIAAKENSVVMGVEGDSKTFWLPSDGDYEVKLIGNDEGTMDYTLSEIDSDIGEIKRVNFFDVEIKDELTFTGDVDNINDEFTVEEHVLVCENQETLEPTETTDEETTEEYTITVTATGEGLVTEEQTAKSGDYVNLSATPAEEWNLIGWYENGELISTEPEIDFVAKSDRNFEVKFEHNHSYEAETVDATCTEDGTITYTCSCGDTYTETIEANKHTDSEWIVDKDSTCSAEGSKHIECTVCKEVLKTEPIAKLPHNYNSVVTESTCEKGGYTTYMCSCGDTYTGDKTPATGHNYNSDDICTECGKSKVDNCSCNCHKSGFMGFIWKILRFFYKLFGMKKTCACGATHY